MTMIADKRRKRLLRGDVRISLSESNPDNCLACGQTAPVWTRQLVGGSWYHKACAAKIVKRGSPSITQKCSKCKDNIPSWQLRLRDGKAYHKKCLGSTANNLWAKTEKEEVPVAPTNDTANGAAELDSLLADLPGAQKKSSAPSKRGAAALDGLLDELEMPAKQSKRKATALDLDNLLGELDALGTGTTGGEDTKEKLISALRSMADGGDPQSLYIDRDLIGEGAPGTKVYCATEVSTGNQVALKVLGLDGANEDDIEAMRREVEVFNLMTHEYMVKYRCCHVTSSEVYIVMEFMDRGSLVELIDDSEDEPITEEVIATVARCVLSVLAHVHDSGWVHRDIKSDNILFSDDGRFVVADFGVAGHCGSGRRSSFVGTPGWMAPEMCTKAPSYDKKVDIYALGCLLLELTEEEPPYGEMSPEEAVEQTLTQGAPKVQDRARWSSPLLSLIDACVERDPSKRPAASELLTFPFLQR